VLHIITLQMKGVPLFTESPPVLISQDVRVIAASDHHEIWVVSVWPEFPRVAFLSALDDPL